MALQQVAGVSDSSAALRIDLFRGAFLVSFMEVTQNEEYELESTTNWISCKAIKLEQCKIVAGDIRQLRSLFHLSALFVAS